MSIDFEKVREITANIDKISKENPSIPMKKWWDSEKKYRDWCMTLNNYTENDENWLFRLEFAKLPAMKTLKFCVIGKEIGESGTPHYQAFFSFSNARYLGGLRKDLSDKAHFEPKVPKSSYDDAIKYCMKGEQSHEEWKLHKWNGENFGKNAIFVTHGEIPVNNQGMRTDLIAVKDEILNGKLVDDIMMENPTMYHQYGRTLHRIEDVRMRNIHRTEMPKVYWFWGSTGVGKTHKARSLCEGKTFYEKPFNDKWWDDYTQQEVVVLNEFRGQIPYEELLVMCDKFYYAVPRRNRPPLPFISPLIIITSCSHPAEIYHRTLTKRDSIDQLMRRIEVVELKPENNPAYEKVEYELPDFCNLPKLKDPYAEITISMDEIAKSKAEKGMNP